jgi:hypothetical protein
LRYQYTSCFICLLLVCGDKTLLSLEKMRRIMGVESRDNLGNDGSAQDSV